VNKSHLAKTNGMLFTLSSKINHAVLKNERKADFSPSERDVEHRFDWNAVHR
jgi:hypothetical protein